LSKIKKLGEIIKKFASASTVIGLARIVRANTRFMQITWVVMTLISLAFGLFLTSGTTYEYLQYDVFTTTKRIQATSSLLPSVTFCFYNHEIKDLKSFFSEASFIRETGKNDDSYLNGKQYYEGYLGEFYATDCIKFNHFTNKSDSQLISTENSASYLYFVIDLNFNFTYVYVFLSDNYDNILDWSQYVTTSYNVKGVYDITFKQEVEIKLEEPYNHCQNVSDLTYRQSNCIVQCKNEKFVDKFNCTLSNFYSIRGFSFCNEEISSSLEFDFVCKEKCPKECTSILFDILVCNPQLSPSSSEKLEFLVWPLGLNYIEISQTPKMSGYSLLNEIGGALGLFVGITCLSMLEFFEFFFEVFLIVFF